jgi:hypothetical protein
MCDEKNMEILIKEVEELKQEIALLKESDKNKTQEIASLKDKEEKTRDVVDANVMVIYDRMARKKTDVCVTFSAICSCVLLFIARFLLINEYDVGYVISCFSFLAVSTSIMIVSVVILVIYAINDFKRFFKNKEWKKRR